MIHEMERSFMRRTALACMTACAMALAIPSTSWAGGTHYLVQIHGGFAVPPTGDSDLSLGWGIEAGYGGRIRGTRIRIYGVLAFDRATFPSEGNHLSTGREWTAERSYNDFLAGARLLIPIWWRLRWYVEVMVGATYLEGTLDWTGTFPLETTDWSGLLAGTTGFEVRWLRHFATGIRAEVRWLMTQQEVLPLVAGEEEASPLRFTVLATQAFLF